MTPDEKEIEMFKLNIEIWKKTIDVQQHFNDLEMKVRNFGLLIIAAFISAIGVSIKGNYNIPLNDTSIPIAAFLSFGAFIIWLLVYFVDVHWYHPLLKGSVLQGMEIEEKLKNDFPTIGLTFKIGESSAIDFFLWKKMRSTTKAKIFYHGISIVLLSLSIVLFSFNSTPLPKKNTTDINVPNNITITLDENNQMIATPNCISGKVNLSLSKDSLSIDCK
ncbi:hypothetical protein [Aliivibrio fischeri]|uniref:hypothetical protein n=2 Tax=Aliivibrio fischeri TaxID=668 RepID=UPI0007C5D527|nr:hypothetical protein [Aliivibrio fischeri]